MRTLSSTALRWCRRGDPEEDQYLIKANLIKVEEEEEEEEEEEGRFIQS